MQAILTVLATLGATCAVAGLWNSTDKFSIVYYTMLFLLNMYWLAGYIRESFKKAK